MLLYFRKVAGNTDSGIPLYKKSNIHISIIRCNTITYHIRIFDNTCILYNCRYIYLNDIIDQLHVANTRSSMQMSTAALMPHTNGHRHLCYTYLIYHISKEISLISIYTYIYNTHFKDKSS